MAVSTSPAARTRVVLFGVMLQGIILLAGCGKSGGTVDTVPVSGTVTVGGTPLPVGTVHFSPDESKGNTFKKTLDARLKPDGTYSLRTVDNSGRASEGAPVGWYKVFFSLDKSSTGPDSKPAKGDEFNAKYKDAKKSGLEIEVKANAPPGAYDIKLTK